MCCASCVEPSRTPSKPVHRRSKLAVMLTSGLLLLGGITCVASRSVPRVYDDELPTVAPRPKSVQMSPGMLPDRSLGQPIENSFSGTSLDPTDDEIAAIIGKVESEE